MVPNRPTDNVHKELSGDSQKLLPIILIIMSILMAGQIENYLKKVGKLSGRREDLGTM